MSTFTVEGLAPATTKVLTHGDLHGHVIATAADSAEKIADEIARRPEGVSARSLIAETVLRAAARVAKGKQTSKFDRVVDELDERGLFEQSATMCELLADAITNV